jgi:hypothetical protein
MCLCVDERTKANCVQSVKSCKISDLKITSLEQYDQNSKDWLKFTFLLKKTIISHGYNKSWLIVFVLIITALQLNRQKCEFFLLSP